MILNFSGSRAGDREGRRPPSRSSRRT